VTEEVSSGGNACDLCPEKPGSKPSLETDCPDIYNGFPQSFQANDKIVPSNKPRFLPSTTFLIQYALIILKFDTTDL
jgi:hypothetical protein